MKSTLWIPRSLAKMSRKIKKEICVLYLQAGQYGCYEIYLEKPILWPQYFNLTRNLHDTTIKFQKSPYLESECYSSIFLLQCKPEDTEINKRIYNLSYEIFKSFLQHIKKTLNSMYSKNHQYYVTKPECESVLEFIERCVENNDMYKTTSLRQLKSTYNRKITRIVKNFANSSKVLNTRDSIEYFNSKFLTLCQEHLNITIVNLEMVQDTSVQFHLE